MNNICVAYLENDIENYPIKNKTLNKKVRWFNYFIFKFGGKVFIKKRADNDIWKDLHEFFLYETDQEIKWDKGKVEKYIKKVFGISDSAFIAYRRLDSQQLTHQTIHGYLIEIKVNEITPSFDKYNGRWLTPEMIRKKAFPKFIQGATLLDL